MNKLIIWILIGLGTLILATAIIKLSAIDKAEDIIESKPSELIPTPIPTEFFSLPFPRNKFEDDGERETERD